MSTQKSPALQHAEEELAEFERIYGIGGAEHQAIIPEHIVDQHRTLVMRCRRLAEQESRQLS